MKIYFAMLLLGFSTFMMISEGVDASSDEGTILVDVSGHSSRYIKHPRTLSPSGKTMAYVTKTQQVVVWDVQTKEEKRLKLHHQGFPMSLCYDPSGEVIAIGYNNGDVILYSVAMGDPIRTLNGAKSDFPSANTVAFSPNGKVLACAHHEGSLKVWNISDDGVEAFPSQTLEENYVMYADKLYFSKDGTRLISTYCDIVMKEWDIDTGICVNKAYGKYIVPKQSVYNAEIQAILSLRKGVLRAEKCVSLPTVTE